MRTRSRPSATLAFLRELVATYGGTAIWGLIDGIITGIVGLAVAEGNTNAPMGLAAGNLYPEHATLMPTPPTAARVGIVTEKAGPLHPSHALFPTPRNDLGWIG